MQEEKLFAGESFPCDFRDSSGGVSANARKSIARSRKRERKKERPKDRLVKENGHEAFAGGWANSTTRQRASYIERINICVD